MKHPLSHLSSRHQKLVLVLFGSMLSLGFYDAVRGALLPTIRISLGLPYGTIGLALFLAGLGYPTAVLLGGILADRFGAWRLATVGYVLMAGASGFAPAVTGSLTFALLILLIHLGLGLLDVSLNAIGGAIFVTKTALMMSYLHLFFGLGASLSPGYASVMLGFDWSWQFVYLSMLVLILPFMLLAWRSRNRQGSDSSTTTERHWSEAFRSESVGLYIGLLALAVSFEIGVSTWHSNYLVAVRGYTPAAAAVYLSFFFGAFTVGRLTGGHIVERTGYVRALIWAPSAAVGFFALGLLLPGMPFLTSLSGYFIGILFPTIIALVSRRYVEHRSSVIGIVMASGIAVQMATIWVVALAHEHLGEELGFSTIALFGVGMIGLVIVFRRKFETE